MKRLIKTLLITALVLISAALLFACSKEPEPVQLSAPSNLQIEDETLMWDEIANASGYIVSTGLNEYPVNNESYSLTGLEPGDYILKVKAKGNGTAYLDSGWSSNIEYSIEAYTKGLRYTLIDGGNSYEVLSLGTATDISTIIIPAIHEGLPVTSIGTYAFNNCASTSITIPDTVTIIRNYAFFYCTSLTSIIIPDSVTNIEAGAFFYCTSLTNITIPNSVTSIGNLAFYNCTSITSITIPSSVTSIESAVFDNCTSLTNITIPNSVTSIGNLAFYNCTSLTSITIPDSVTSISNETFLGCSSLNSITVDSNNANYSSEDGVLFNKDKTVLIRYPEGKADVNYIIPNSVTGIGDGAFSNYTSLISITIPDSVTSIGNSAFYDCFLLNSIIVDSNNANYSSEDGVLFNKDKTVLIRYPEGKADVNYIIPNSVTSIGNSAFYGCINLICITIPDSVTIIEDRAFFNCINLTSITIPDSITSIGDYAFAECTSLTSITIPNNVTSIGYSFSNCTNLTIYCEAESKPDEWYEYWNDSSHPYDLNRPVIWGCTLNSETGTYVVSFTKTDSSILNPNEYTINAPYREGYTFGGWAITPDGTKEFDAADIADAPNGTTLYAIWDAIQNP